MIPPAVLDLIKRQTDLPALVREAGHPLKARSGYQIAFCPWCVRPKTAALYVYTDHLYCHRCHKALNSVGFIMETQGLSFPDAAQYLADRAGISLANERKSRLERAADAEDVPMSQWWIQRHWEACRQALDRALADDDLDFARVSGRLLRHLEKLTVADRLNLFRGSVTSEDRREWRREVRWEKEFEEGWLSCAT